LVAMAQAKLKMQDETSVASVAKIWLDAYEARQKQLGLEGKSGLVTRKELEGLIKFVQIDIVPAKGKEEPFAIVSIGEALKPGEEVPCLKVVKTADEIGVNIATTAELVRVTTAKEVLAKRKQKEPSLVELEGRVKKLEERLGSYIGEKDKIIEYLNSKDAFDDILKRAKSDNKTSVNINTEYVITKLKASGKDMGMFKGEADVDAAINELTRRINEALNPPAPLTQPRAPAEAEKAPPTTKVAEVTTPATSEVPKMFGEKGQSLAAELAKSIGDQIDIIEKIMNELPKEEEILSVGTIEKLKLIEKAGYQIAKLIVIIKSVLFLIQSTDSLVMNEASFAPFCGKK